MPRLIFKYGFLLFLALASMKLIEYQFFSHRIDLEVYLAIIATIFLLLGGGVAWYLKPKQVVEKDIEIDKEALAKFSPREQEMLVFLAKGYSNKEIAKSLEISDNTVKTHLKKLYERLQVNSRNQAVAEAKYLKLIK